MRALSILLSALLAVTPAFAADPAHYTVYKGSRAVLEIIDRPGPLTSTASRPPNMPAVQHPFLTGSALSAPDENDLSRLLKASTSTADYLKKLEAAGYR